MNVRSMLTLLSCGRDSPVARDRGRIIRALGVFTSRDDEDVKEPSFTSIYSILY
jgi:hypothetical protein